MRWMDTKMRPPTFGQVVHDVHCIAFVDFMTISINSLHLYFVLDMSLPEG